MLSVAVAGGGGVDLRKKELKRVIIYAVHFALLIEAKEKGKQGDAT